MSLKHANPNAEFIESVYDIYDGTFGVKCEIYSRVLEELINNDNYISLNSLKDHNRKQYLAIMYQDGYWVGCLTKSFRDYTVVDEHRSRNIVDVINYFNE